MRQQHTTFSTEINDTAAQQQYLGYTYHYACYSIHTAIVLVVQMRTVAYTEQEKHRHFYSKLRTPLAPYMTKRATEARGVEERGGEGVTPPTSNAIFTCHFHRRLSRMPDIPPACIARKPVSRLMVRAIK